MKVRLQIQWVVLCQVWLPPVMLVASVGCGIDFAYLIPAASGQLNYMNGSIPIEEALDQPSLTEEQKTKIALIIDVRRFAGEELGLSTDTTYKMFYDTEGQPVGFNLSAAKQYALEPYLWWFPVVGDVPYLLFFDRSAADERAKQLEREGYDTFIYDLDAYNQSILGFNPLFSPMLQRDDINLVETVIHELLHATIYSGDTSYNESLATFIGRTGSRLYYASRYDDDPSVLTGVSDYYEDEDRFNAFASDLYDRLDVLYSFDMGLLAIDGKSVVFRDARQRFKTDIQPLMHQPERYDWVERMPDNNAFIMGWQRYNAKPLLFQEVYEAEGSQWETALAVFAEASTQADPFGYLTTWLACRGNTDQSSACDQLISSLSP